MFAMDEELEYEQYANNQQAVGNESRRSPKFAAVPTTSRKGKNNVVNLPQAEKPFQVKLVEPHSYDDAKMITDHLEQRHSVVINLHLVNDVQLRRILDFVYGYIYAINGDIQKVGANIYMCTPDTVEISGTISALEFEDYDVADIRRR